MTRARLARLAALLLVLFGARPAMAESEQGPWLRLERLEASPSMIEGYAQIRLHATAVNLQGVFLDDITGKDAWSLTLNKKRERVPYIAGRFEGMEDELAIAFVIATTPGFNEALPAIKKEVAALLEALPRKRTQVTIIGYDSSVEGVRRVQPVARALKDLEDLTASAEPGPEQLLKAVDLAYRAVTKAKPLMEGAYVRRLIVVVSDGRDEDYPKAESYRKVSKRAGREGVPIHTIAFAPDGNRLPLRGLGELSKQSSGTFRFAYTKAGFANHFEQLGKEVLGQYVLTFFVREDEVMGKRVGLVAGAKGLESTDSERVAKLACGEATCSKGQYCVNHTCVARVKGQGRGVLGWVLLAGGVVVGLVILFVALSLVLAGVQRRKANAALLAAAGAQAPAAEAAQGTGQTGQTAQDPQRIAGQAPGQPPHQPGAHQHVQPTGPHQAAPPTGQQRILPTGQQRILPTGQQHVLPTGQHQPLSGAYPGMPQPSLLIIKGPLQGRRIPLHHNFLIGKAPNCHLQLMNDSFASTHHAQILMDTRGNCTLVDQRSTNGTFVNGVRTTEKVLSHGMLITIGSTEARFLAQ